MLGRINWIDVFILILLFRTSYVGFSYGLTKYFFNFVSIVLASCIAIHFYDGIAIFLTNNLSYLPYKVSALLSFAILAFGFLILLKIFIFMVSRLVKIEFAPFLEKLGGTITGFVYGLLLSSLLLVTFSLSQTEYMRASLSRSFLTSFVIKAAPGTYDVVLKILPFEPSSGRPGIETEFIEDDTFSNN